MSLATRRVRGMLAKWLDCSGGQWVRADRSKLADALSLSVRTVQRALNDLREEANLPDGWTFRSCHKRGRGREVLVCAQPWALPGAEPLDWDGQRWRGVRPSFRPGVEAPSPGPSDNNKGLTPRRCPAQRGATGAAGAVVVRHALQQSEHGRWLRRSVKRTLERRGRALWRRGAWRGDIERLAYSVAREVRIAVKESHARKPEAYAAKCWESGAAKLKLSWASTWEQHAEDWSPGGRSYDVAARAAESMGVAVRLPAGIAAKLEPAAAGA